MKKLALALALVLLAGPALAHDTKSDKAGKGKSCCAGEKSAAKCPAGAKADKADKVDKNHCADEKSATKDAKPADAAAAKPAS